MFDDLNHSNVTNMQKKSVRDHILFHSTVHGRLHFCALYTPGHQGPSGSSDEVSSNLSFNLLKVKQNEGEAEADCFPI